MLVFWTLRSEARSYGLQPEKDGESKMTDEHEGSSGTWYGRLIPKLDTHKTGDIAGSCC